MAVPAGGERKEVELHGVRAEFRTALREELEAARRASASGAIQLVNGRRIAQVGGAYQYLFLVESALNAPDDSPGDLYVPGAKPVETTIISVDGLAVTLSVPLDLGAFVPRAALQSDLTHLLRTLIERIEELADKENPAGDRLLGAAAPSGEQATIEPSALNVEQMAAVASSVGRDTTFIWGPPGTGKTRTIGQIGVELLRRGRSLLLVSHTNAVVQASPARHIRSMRFRAEWVVFGSGRLFACGWGRTACSHSVTRGTKRPGEVKRATAGPVSLWSRWVSASWRLMVARAGEGCQLRR
jgi:hypothetical protein